MIKYICLDTTAKRIAWVNWKPDLEPPSALRIHHVRLSWENIVDVSNSGYIAMLKRPLPDSHHHWSHFDLIEMYRSNLIALQAVRADVAGSSPWNEYQNYSADFPFPIPEDTLAIAFLYNGDSNGALWFPTARIVYEVVRLSELHYGKLLVDSSWLINARNPLGDLSHPMGYGT